MLFRVWKSKDTNFRHVLRSHAETSGTSSVQLSAVQHGNFAHACVTCLDENLVLSVLLFASEEEAGR